MLGYKREEPIWLKKPFLLLNFLLIKVLNRNKRIIFELKHIIYVKIKLVSNLKKRNRGK